MFGGNVRSLRLSKKVDMTHGLKVVIPSVATVAVLILAFGGTWRFAYGRGFGYGYAQGAREEFLRWKQDPIRMESDWDGKITGHRNMMEEKPAVFVREPTVRPVNAWSAPISATGVVSVSAAGARGR